MYCIHVSSVIDWKLDLTFIFYKWLKSKLHLIVVKSKMSSLSSKGQACQIVSLSWGLRAIIANNSAENETGMVLVDEDEEQKQVAMYGMEG